MPPRIVLFDWDEENEAHIARHRITPEEVEQCFFNPHIQTPKPNFLSLTIFMDKQMVDGIFS